MNLVDMKNSLLKTFLIWGLEKKSQNEQTEQKQGFALLLVTRRHTLVRREAKFVYSKKKLINKKNRKVEIFLH